ncbi:MAG: hypothetical protein NC217_03970 [Muribaculaceae bacterium]|nr:hypothetical protein [Muribaculaceae bacterium]
MSEDITSPNNPYNNEAALREVVKMMTRGEKLTLKFVLDDYGYESIQVESPRVEKFILQLSNDLFSFLFQYLLKGEITNPTPSAKDGLMLSKDSNSNDFAEDILRSMILFGEDFRYMHIIPEIADTVDTLTVNFAYPFGIIVFRIKRSPKIMEVLESKGF